MRKSELTREKQRLLWEAKMKVLVTTNLNFEAAHMLNSKKQTEEVNEQWFGKCKNLHGHNYKLFVTVEGNIRESGMVVNFVEMKKIIREKIVDVYDHSLINDLMEEIPTAENMCLLFWEKLEREFKDINVNLYEIKLYETDNSFVTIKR